MWCTRWFLPLLLLPLPTAPPYLLLLFLFSLTMHARPCFYCIVLLTALFVSSCYWQPLPLDTPLSIPWSENITTFSDALDASTASLNLGSRRPKVNKLMDRCWCDLSAGSLFEPFDTKQWEVGSVERLVAELEKEQKADVENSNRERENGELSTAVTPAVLAGQTAAPASASRAVEGSSSSAPSGRKGAFSTLSSVFWRSPISNTSDVLEHPEVPPISSALEDERRAVSGEIDLQPYGFDLVLDFKWSRRSS